MQGTRHDDCAAVQHLSSLTQLEQLGICASGWSQGDRAAWYYGDRLWPVLPSQLLSGLTALTQLEGNFFAVDLPASIGSCMRLQKLAVCLRHDSQQLGVDGWACLARLTCLTELRLLNAHMFEASSEACAALRKLSKLQLIGAACWSPAILPALTACVQLSQICGKWIATSARAYAPATAVLPGVTVLAGAAGACPFESFPNLSSFQGACLADGLEFLHPGFGLPSILESLSQHCTNLCELDMTASSSSVAGRAYHSAEAAARSVRVAAIRSLTALQHLTCLKFTPRDDYELVALGHACSVLEGHSLQELHLNQGRNSEVTAAAFMQLRHLRALPKLFLHLVSQDAITDLATDALMFLSALSGCRAVQLRLPVFCEPPMLRKFTTALKDLRDAGLPAPQFDWWAEPRSRV